MTPESVRILETPVLPVSVDEASSVIGAWAADGGGRVVCAANVHMVMDAWDEPSFAAHLAGADLTVCDGRPLVWACRLQGVRDARQARGLDVMMAATSLAARRGLRVGLYGGRPEVLAEVKRRLLSRDPALDVAYCWSPPFRELTSSEDDDTVAAIEAAGVQLLFVSLGCPRQEQWMFAHRDRLDCVMVGVGAAFDMLSGSVRTAPRWMQRLGLEWVFRLVLEPRRLWCRYSRHNGRFIVLVLRDWWHRASLGRRRGQRV